MAVEDGRGTRRLVLFVQFNSFTNILLKHMMRVKNLLHPFLCRFLQLSNALNTFLSTQHQPNLVAANLFGCWCCQSPKWRDKGQTSETQPHLSYLFGSAARFLPPSPPPSACHGLGSRGCVAQGSVPSADRTDSQTHCPTVPAHLRSGAARGWTDCIVEEKHRKNRRANAAAESMSQTVYYLYLDSNGLNSVCVL